MRPHDLKRHLQEVHFFCSGCSNQFGDQSEMLLHKCSGSSPTIANQHKLPMQVGTSVIQAITAIDCQLLPINLHPFRFRFWGIRTPPE